VRISATPAVLRQAAQLGGMRAVRFPLRPVPVTGAGSPISEAVSLTGASSLQSLGIDGSGVKVAVLDVGFINLAAAKSNGNIPSSAIAVDFAGMGMEVNTAHGTAVTEEVADMAPGAQIYTLLFGDEVDFQNAADYLAANNIHIANLSVNWFGTSYYDDTGPISDIVNHSHDVDGVFWAVGAGNWSFRHWRGPWLDEDSDGWQSFAPGNVERLDMVAELSQICWVLNWNQYPDQYKGAITNLDLFVFSKTGAVVASGQNVQTAGSPPVEQACFNRVASQEPYQIGVRRISGPTANLELSLVSSDAGLVQQVNDSSGVDPAVAHGAFSVGAIDQSLWLAADPSIENFSSHGPTTDGRPKPEIVAPDRTQTFAYGAALGTSFASPVVAGAAALLAEQAPGITANQIRAALVSSAVDGGPPGRDEIFGYGKLNVPMLILPLNSDGDALPDSSDPCPFAANAACNCGDVDGSGVVNAQDESSMRAFLAAPVSPPPHPQLCNVHGPAGPTDCKIDDWAVMRRARAGKLPGIQSVCAPALPP
jgi:subtilisin family serine protease